MISQKREQLLDAAERLFETQGFHATGIDRIVTAAGVVRMTLYNHFASKDALIQTVLARRHERFLAALDAAVTASAPGKATAALVAAHGEWLATRGDHGCIMVRAMGEFAEQNPALHTQAAAAKEDLRTRVRDAVARDAGTPDPDRADRIFLALEGWSAAVPLMGAKSARHLAESTIKDLSRAG